MKRLSILFLSFVGMAYWSPSQAQFFKKLKKTVNNTVNSVSSEINTDDHAGANSTGGLYTVKATHADLSAYQPLGVCTLQPGEKFDFTESCLAMHAGISSAQVVIIKDGNRYLIGKNGQRIPKKGDNIHGCPVAYESNTGNIATFISYGYNAPNVDQEATENFADLYVHSSSGVSGNFQTQHNLTTQQQVQMKRLADKMEKEQDSGGTVDMATAMKAAQLAKGMNMQGNMHYNKDSSGTYITFNHKKFGPYAYVRSMLINKAKNKFVAIVVPGDPDMPLAPESYSLLITSEGLKKKNTFLAADLVPFGDFNHYHIMIKDKVPEILYDPVTGKQIPIINNDVNNIRIDKSTGALIQVVNDQVYVDGKLVKTLPGKVDVRPQNIFISKDHMQCAIWTPDGLYLPDGHKIDGVLSCNKQMKNGKTIINWIVLGSDNKTLILCHETL